MVAGGGDLAGILAGVDSVVKGEIR